MYKNQPTNDVTAKPSIEAFALPSELRRTHNFASRARPIIGLDLPLKTTSSSTTTPASLRFSHAPRRRSAAMPETDFLIESRLGDNDTAHGLPASWREPQQSRPQRRRRRWSWSERSIAAFSGFAGGLIVVLPLIFMLGSHATITPSSDRADRTAGFSFASTAAYVENVWNTATKASELKPALAPAEPAETAALLPVAEIETKALTALEVGNLDEARRTLRTAASAENPRLWLLLAQTYDPAANAMPAADPSASTGDIEFARFYYRQALANGIEAARPRLEALAPR